MRGDRAHGDHGLSTFVVGGSRSLPERTQAPVHGAPVQALDAQADSRSNGGRATRATSHEPRRPGPTRPALDRIGTSFRPPRSGRDLPRTAPIVRSVHSCLRGRPHTGESFVTDNLAVGACGTRGIARQPVFEHFFEELVDLGGVTEADPETLIELSDRYAFEMDADGVPALLQRFELQFPGELI